MDLRELRTEVHSLKNVAETVRNFKQNLIKPLQKNTNPQFYFLPEFDSSLIQELNPQIKALHRNIDEIAFGQTINDRLKHHIKSLIELKLTTFNNDHRKAKMLLNILLNDDYFKIQNTIAKIKEFEEQVQQFSDSYQKLNQNIQQNLSLEEGVKFSEYLHRNNFKEIQRISVQQKKIIKELGTHFLSLAKEVQVDLKKNKNNKNNQNENIYSWGR